MAYPPPPGISSLPSRPPVPDLSSSSPADLSSSSPAPFAASTVSAPPSIQSPVAASSAASPPSFSHQWHSPSYAARQNSFSNYGSSHSHSTQAPPGAAATTYGAPPSYHAPPTTMGSSSSYSARTPAPAPYGYHGAAGHHPQMYGGSPSAPAHYGASPTTPQIQNPFPAPGQAHAHSHGHGAGSGGDYDPEMAAAIATWQSAYVTRDSSAAAAAPAAGANERNGFMDGPPDFGGAGAGAGAEGTGADQAERKKTVARQGGGQKWTDDSLLEWDPSHFRIFIGNLAGETNDASLFSAFAEWKSVSKARVIRDKTTSKSKGYGFVSFSDADDFFSAAKEMNGRYIGNHPVVIHKATTEIKVTNVKEKEGSHWRNKKKSNRNNNHNNGSSSNNSSSNYTNNNNNSSGSSNNIRSKYKEDGDKYESTHGGTLGGRITKPGQKTKNGLKLLG